MCHLIQFDTRQNDMRVNFTLNENNNKDKVIIDFLENKYNATYYIKNLLYDMALGNSIPIIPIQQGIVNQEQEYDEIENLNDIDL